MTRFAMAALRWLEGLLDDAIRGIVRLIVGLLYASVLIVLHRHFFAPDEPITNMDFIAVFAIIAYLRSCEPGGRKDG